AAAGWRQAGWEAEVTRAGVVTTAQGVGSQQVLVAWPFAPLASRERAAVRLRVRGDDGAWSAWSEQAEVEAGLLRPDDWSARPVGPAWEETMGDERRPALVRRAFALDR